MLQPDDRQLFPDPHSLRVPESMIPARKDSSGSKALIAPEDPLAAILEESEQMAAEYIKSPLGRPGTKRNIMDLLDRTWKLKNTSGPAAARCPYRCCINTELNSTNFLINGRDQRNYLIDWEKPLYGDPAQDLGHFLAPTTTFWKTDILLDEEARESFIREYISRVAGRYDTSGLAERTRLFTAITCLRGITWCAMAWVEYRTPGRELINQSTAHKLDQYLDEEFLDGIRDFLHA